MLMPNFTYKAGNFYTFAAIVTASTTGKCVLDRPVKKIRLSNTDLTLVDSEGHALATADADKIYEFPCIYGYPQIILLASGSGESIDETPYIEVLEYGDDTNEEYFECIQPLIYAIRAKGGTANVLGKVVSTLQSSIAFDNIKGSVTGTLLYATDYTGFSGDPELQEGNYLVWAVDTSETGATYKAWLTNSRDKYDEAHAVTLDSDKDAVMRIEDKDRQVLYVKATKSGRASVTRHYSLTGLTITPKEN